MEDDNEFFETLLAHIEERRIIPIVGPDLLTLPHRGRVVPLYHAVAAQVLEYYGRTGVSPGEAPAGSQTVVLRPGRELNDAVASVLDDRRRDPYSLVPRALASVLKDGREAMMPPLRALASIDDFSLYVTTTLDDLLATAIDEVRHGGAEKTRRILHVPNLPTDEFRDITDGDLASSQFTAVLSLFGRARNAQLYAAHDEDMLEYVHNLQTRESNVPERFVAKLRSLDLLFVGCSLPEWLGRFFLRLSSVDRLGDDRRPKREFLVGDIAADAGDGLVVFLERFSRQTNILRSNPQQFVTELARRWRERHPVAGGIPPATASPTARSTQDAVFISYTRSDFAAARRLRSDLQSVGIDAVWFDHEALKPGDDWSRHIATAIKSCYLFLPLISSNTESRHEGYFREEWKQAEERLRQIEGRTFIVPIVIDAGYTCNAAVYRLVPEAFPRKHFGHAPGGQMNEALRQHLIDLIRECRLSSVA